MGFDVTVLGTSGNRKMKRCPGLSLEFQGRGDLSTIQLIGHLLPSNFEYLKMGFDVSIGTPSTVLIRSRPSFDLTFSELRFSPRTAVHPRISSASQLMWSLLSFSPPTTLLSASPSSVTPSLGVYIFRGEQTWTESPAGRLSPWLLRLQSTERWPRCSSRAPQDWYISSHCDSETSMTCSDLLDKKWKGWRRTTQSIECYQFPHEFMWDHMVPA